MPLSDCCHELNINSRCLPRLQSDSKQPGCNTVNSIQLATHTRDNVKKNYANDARKVVFSSEGDFASEK